MAADTHQAWQDITFTARDGLRLHARRYPAPMSNRRPVLCLAGLTRNSRDFHDLAMALSDAGDQSRTVYALDARGRGMSEHDPDWRNYSIPVETLDAADFISAHGLQGSAIVGTSRGGLSAMLLAVMQPGALGAVVLNDIGPVVELEGLVRIIGYVGRTPLPHSWTEAAKLVQSINRRHFPAVPLETWDEVARAWFNDKAGRPAAGYDEHLAKTISVADGPVPELWPQFGALAHVPLLVIRGGNSDILSAATVAAMRQRHPNAASITVSGQGHAPLLKDAFTTEAIGQFLAETDRGRRVTGRIYAAA